jgi:hypothetical protein
LKFAPKGSEVAFQQVLASEKPPKLYLEVHLKSTNHLKALGTKIIEVEKIFSLGEFAPLPPKKSKLLDYTSFTLFPSRLNSSRSKM